MMYGHGDFFIRPLGKPTVRRVVLRAIAVMLTVVFNLGCQTTYYAVWETMGKEKRHLLKENVEKARQDQVSASEQFASVLENIKSMYGFDGGELEDIYDRLRDDYQACEHRAEAVRERMEKVERIATDLFEEWEAEIATIKNKALQSKSQASLQDTQNRFARLQHSMEQAEESMEPVLTNFHDYVVYLKHNLNAQSITSLKNEVVDIETEVASLISDMNHSIREADAFINSM